MDKPSKEIITGFKLAVITALISIIVSPVAVYITINSTDLFRKPELSVAGVSYDLTLNSYDFNKTFLIEISRNPDLTTRFNETVVNTLSNLSNKNNSLAEEYIHLFPLLATQMKDGFVESFDPLTGKFLLKVGDKNFESYLFEIEKLQSNLDITKNYPDSNINLLSEVTNISTYSIRKLIAKEKKNEAIIIYQERLREVIAAKDLLGNINRSIGEVLIGDKITRTGGLGFTVGVVNYGYSTGIIKDHAHLEIDGMTLPLNKWGNPFTPVTTKDYIEIKYTINSRALTDEQKERFVNVINTKKDIPYTLVITSSESELSHRGTFKAKHKEFFVDDIETIAMKYIPDA